MRATYMTRKSKSVGAASKVKTAKVWLVMAIGTVSLGSGKNTTCSDMDNTHQEHIRFLFVNNYLLLLIWTAQGGGGSFQP